MFGACSDEMPCKMMSMCKVKAVWAALTGCEASYMACMFTRLLSSCDAIGTEGT